MDHHLTAAPILYRLDVSLHARKRQAQERQLQGAGQPFTDLHGPNARQNLPGLLLTLTWLALGDGYAPDLAAFEVLL